ncbi:MAG: CIA30 family protein [Cyanobacteria bacterium P01_D01_bin.36]
MSNIKHARLKVVGALGISAALWWLASFASTPQAQQPMPSSEPSSESSETTTSETTTIADFDDPAEANGWRNVDDTVMGGVSQSAFSITEDGYGLFSGTLSLENNGGFTSVRRVASGEEFTGAQAMLLRVKGDGRPYQLRLKMETSDRAVSYKSEFETTGEWQILRLPIESFEAVFRGRAVEDAPTLDPSEVKEIGFLLASKDSGDFQLEIDWIQAEQ